MICGGDVVVTLTFYNLNCQGGGWHPFPHLPLIHFYVRQNKIQQSFFEISFFFFFCTNQGGGITEYRYDCSTSERNACTHKEKNYLHRWGRYQPGVETLAYGSFLKFHLCFFNFIFKKFKSYNSYVQFNYVKQTRPLPVMHE